MIILKKDSEIAKMREAGRIVARTNRLMAESIVPGKTSLLELDALAERLITESGGRPAFKGYRGYKHALCASPNDVVIHGIPSDYVLQEGDIVGLDIGVEKDGWCADSGWTYAVGSISDEARRLMAVTKESLFQGIAKAKPGNRVGDISATVQKYVERNKYGVVRDLVGHGIGRTVHEPEPSIPNFGKPNTGHVLKAGMTFCVEPMVNQGTHKVIFKPDGWTVVTADGKLSAHFEHTVAVTSDGPVLLTVEHD